MILAQKIVEQLPQSEFMHSESYRTVIVVTALVKEDERGRQGHTSVSLLHQFAT
jgi:hypothetical protein